MLFEVTRVSEPTKIYQNLLHIHKKWAPTRPRDNVCLLSRSASFFHRILRPSGPPKVNFYLGNLMFLRNHTNYVCTYVFDVWWVPGPILDPKWLQNEPFLDPFWTQNRLNIYKHMLETSSTNKINFILRFSSSGEFRDPFWTQMAPKWSQMAPKWPPNYTNIDLLQKRTPWRAFLFYIVVVG